MHNFRNWPISDFFFFKISKSQPIFEISIHHSQADKHIEKSDDKQGLFVEYIQFLIKIGMFNKNVVMSMLSNKEIFM